MKDENALTRLGNLSLEELEDRVKRRMEKLRPDLYEYDEGAWDELRWLLNLIQLPN